MDTHIPTVEIILGINKGLPFFCGHTILENDIPYLANAYKVSIGCFNIKRYEVHVSNSL